MSGIMLSSYLACSSSSAFSSEYLPRDNRTSIHIYLSKPKFRSFSAPISSMNFFRNSKCLSRRGRSNAKSDEAEIAEQQSPQFPAMKNKTTAATNQPSSLLSFLCPLLKLFGGGDPSQERNEFLEVATSSLSTLARLPWGSRSISGIRESSKDSPMYLQLYEFEACPFCRRVREALTELDLSVEVYPCPKGSLRHREFVKKAGGREQFPFLIDPNTGISMYESGDIVTYLFQQYGHGKKPSFGLLESTLFTGWMPTILRAGRGLTLWARAKPEPPPEKFEVFSYENNQHARIVREALCELELPYVLHNVGEGSSNFDLLIQKSGSEEVPYLVDPNTGVQLSNYKKILSYLFQTYAIAD